MLVRKSSLDLNNTAGHLSLLQTAKTMLGSSAEGLITKLASYLTADKHPVLDETSSTENEATLVIPVINSRAREAGNKNGNSDLVTLISTPDPRRPLTRSANVMVAPNQNHSERLTAIAALSAIHFEEDERRVTNSPQTLPRATLQPPRRTTRRSLSSSRVELRSPYFDAATSLKNAPKQHTEQAIPVISRLPRLIRAHYGSSVSGPVTRTRPSPTRSTALRSSSDPDLAKAFAHPKTRDCNLPLKPCIKKQAGSATAASLVESQQAAMAARSRTLHRVKTVDFKGNGTMSLPSLSQYHTTQDSLDKLPTISTEKTRSCFDTARKAVKESPSRPNPIGITKSSVADMAVTRTDVHVIAITPQWNAQDMINEEEVDPATPTMQIIETKSASYEIVWDDVPPEQSVRISARRSSPASHALEAATPGGTRDLERVNSKLACWSGTWNTPSERFKPTIVVFPDDDGRATYYDCALEMDDEAVVSTPPNSQMTSCTSSRFPSRPASAPITRTASKEEISFSDALNDIRPQFAEHLSPVLEQTLVVPDGEVRVGGERNMKTAIGFRKLSNVEEVATRFRGHRDSVTIAHSRLVRSRGVSSEPFAHRDSVSVARKRTRARNHATSVARAMSLRRETLGEMRNLADDDDDDMSGVSLPTVNLVRERAAQALKNSSSSSMLRSPHQTPNQRHIRIVE